MPRATKDHRSRTRLDDRAVSPVVGVALLVGITVILATVIGTVVLGVGVGPAQTPEATVSFDVVSGEVEVVHEGGDELRKSEIVIRDTNGTEYQLASDLVTGQRATVVDAGGTPLDLNATSVDRLTIVWQSSDGTSERVLATFRP